MKSDHAHFEKQLNVNHEVIVYQMVSSLNTLGPEMKTLSNNTAH